MSDWKPIATAPTDGTRVLTAQGGFISMARWASKFSAEHFGNDAPGWYDDILNRRAYPTHWMPLPDAPALPTPTEQIG